MTLFYPVLSQNQTKRRTCNSCLESETVICHLMAGNDDLERCMHSLFNYKTLQSQKLELLQVFFTYFNVHKNCVLKMFYLI